MKHLVRLYNAGLELTMACPCRCATCGSSAGRPRPDELSTGEWCAVLGDLAALGCRRATFLGGEPLLLEDWPVLVREARRVGIHTDLITSALGVDAQVADAMKKAGLVSVTVSVDGTRDVHDAQRRVPGCYDHALEAIRIMDQQGLRVGVTTQVNATTLPTLETLAPILQEAGALGWQLQITIPTGRAAHLSDLIVIPDMMGELLATIRRLVRRRGLRPFVTDDIGWFTRDDPVLRTPQGSPERCFMGCFAGLRAIGITSDGGVKGCLSLPDSMTEGNVRDESLASIWNDPGRFSYNRAFDPASLSGACTTCDVRTICRGGCTALAVSVHGRAHTSTHCFRVSAPRETEALV